MCPRNVKASDLVDLNRTRSRWGRAGPWSACAAFADLPTHGVTTPTSPLQINILLDEIAPESRDLESRDWCCL